MLSDKEIKEIKSLVNKSNANLAKLFDALGDVNRFKIFVLLLKAKNNICVTEFADILDISVPAASQQLKLLELSGLIERVRSGQMICYEVRYQDSSVKQIVKIVQAVS